MCWSGVKDIQSIQHVQLKITGHNCIKSRKRKGTQIETLRRIRSS